jgi:hypothetical protein
VYFWKNWLALDDHAFVRIASCNVQKIHYGWPLATIT